MKWWKKWFSKKASSSYQLQYEQGDRDRLFTDLEQTYYKKKKLQLYIANVTQKQEELQKYEHFTKEMQDKLLEYVKGYKLIEEQKQVLRGRLITNNAALNRLVPYEEQLPNYINEMQQVEKQLHNSERDLFYLEEEKEELIADREILLGGYTFLKGFSMVFLMVLVICLFVAFAWLQVIREEIWVVLSGIAIVFVLFLVGILYAKERLEKRLQNNTILQQKAVKYINKSNIRYFHQKRYMDYLYEKFGVDSTAKLEMHYNRYLKNKLNEKQFLQYNRQLAQIENGINELLINGGEELVHLDTLEEWLIIPKRAKLYQNLMADKQKVCVQLEELEAFEKELWQEVYTLKEDPKNILDIEMRVEKYLNDTQQSLDKKEESPYNKQRID